MTLVNPVPTLVWTRKSATSSLMLAVEEHRKEMGLRLATLRDQRGLTQEELAYAAGLSAKTISRLENGRHEAELDTIRKLAKVLTVDETEIRGPSPPLDFGSPSQLDRIERVVNEIHALLLGETPSGEPVVGVADRLLQEDASPRKPTAVRKRSPGASRRRKTA